MAWFYWRPLYFVFSLFIDSMDLLRYLCCQSVFLLYVFLILSPSLHHRQDKQDCLSCQWCEQNWRQVKTVFSSTHCISRLDKTVSKFSVADSLTC